MKKLMAAAILAVTSAQTFAADGNQLYGWLTDPQEVMRLEALGYILGILDQDYFSGEAEQHFASGRGVLPHVCRPNGQTGRQLLDIVKNELEQHPEIRSQPGAQIVWSVFHRYFPCKS